MQVSVRERTLATHLKSPAVFTFEHSRRLPRAMGTVMKDIHAKPEKLLTEAEDCELIGRTGDRRQKAPTLSKSWRPICAAWRATLKPLSLGAHRKPNKAALSRPGLTHSKWLFLNLNLR